MINGFGLLGSIGRLLVIVMDTFHTSRAEAILIQSMASGVMGIVGIVTGSFVHKYQPRICGMVGASLTSLGFSLCFFATSIVYLYVGMGLMFGIGLSLVTISCTTIIGVYFEGKLKLIVLSLTSVTGAVGGMTYPYVIMWLNDLYGLPGALLIIGAITLHSFAASLLWSDPKKTIEVQTTEAVDSEANGLNRKETDDHTKMKLVSKSLISDIVSTDISRERKSYTIHSTESVKQNSYRNQDNGANGNDRYLYSNAAFVTDNANGEHHNSTGSFRICDKNVSNANVTNSTNQVPNSPTGANDNNITTRLKALFRNKMFVTFIVAVTLINLSYNVFLFLLVDILRDKDLIDSSSLALLLMSLFSMVGRFSSGTLTVIPHVTVLSIPMVGSCLLAAAHISMIFVKSLTLTLFISSVFGVCMGICRAQFTVTISRLLDDQHLSIGMGVLFTLFGCINTFMGPLCGYARDQIGIYDPIFIGAAIASVLGCCMFSLAQYFSSRNKRS